VSLDTLVAANALRDPDLLRPGQQLLVPSVDGVLHTVALGDTLRLIAQRYGVELSALIDANDLGATPDVLTVGRVLIVPGARAMLRLPNEAPVASEEAEQQVARTTATPRPTSYVVGEGDTLRSIAQAFELDILSLVSINQLSDPDLITPGRTLRVAASDTLEHTVETGETVADIAWRYQIASTALLDANGVANPDHIVSGSVLIVPGGRARPAEPPAQVALAEAAAQARPAQPAPSVRLAPTSTPTPQRRVAPIAKPTSVPAPVVVAPSGERVITAKVTGYAIGAGAVSNRTASGTQTHWGTVAADTRLYPFGTRVRIQGFEETVFVVEDTGSAVRGNVFDVWFPDAASARRLGAQTRQVTILP